MALVSDEVTRAWRYDRMFSIALARIDPIDCPEGDGVDLKPAEIELTLLEFLAGQIRAPDKIALLGSGEYGILFPETNAWQACIAAQRLCEGAAATTFRAGGRVFDVTLSIGAATLSHHMRSAEQLLLAARQEWRSARSLGGNRIAATPPAIGRTGYPRSGELH